MRNTAVFYDIENLLKGYGFSRQLLDWLSVKTIVGQIKARSGDGAIAMQRAYANWSDPRLKTLRRELDNLGVQQVQIFCGGYDSRKNAADIQLALDAAETAHTHPTLSNYVIVSGDGGFTALAVRLREHGKQVIGCSYQESASRTFREVCDGFIDLPNPPATMRQAA